MHYIPIARTFNQITENDLTTQAMKTTPHLNGRRRSHFGTHMHIHTCTYTHAYTHAHAHVHPCTDTGTRTCTCMLIHAFLLTG